MITYSYIVPLFGEPCNCNSDLDWKVVVSLLWSVSFESRVFFFSLSLFIVFVHRLCRYVVLSLIIWLVVLLIWGRGGVAEALILINGKRYRTTTYFFSLSRAFGCKWNGFKSHDCIQIERQSCYNNVLYYILNKVEYSTPSLQKKRKKAIATRICNIKWRSKGVNT